MKSGEEDKVLRGPLFSVIHHQSRRALRSEIPHCSGEGHSPFPARSMGTSPSLCMRHLCTAGELAGFWPKGSPALRSVSTGSSVSGNGCGLPGPGSRCSGHELEHLQAAGRGQTCSPSAHPAELRPYERRMVHVI